MPRGYLPPGQYPGVGLSAPVSLSWLSSKKKTLVLPCVALSCIVLSWSSLTLCPTAFGLNSFPRGPKQRLPPWAFSFLDFPCPFFGLLGLPSRGETRLSSTYNLEFTRLPVCGVLRVLEKLLSST